MDQMKIGRFIAERRHAAGLTQAKVAEALNITDRAVSKWETGKSMPDSAIMLELCGLLGITVNELLSGEKLEMEVYNQAAEENLLELQRRQEVATKLLLTLEWVIGFSCLATFFVLLLAASFLVEAMPWRALLIAYAILQFAVGMYFGMKLERVAGYYACERCGHRYVPDPVPFVFSMHMGRTRYLKCPHCGERSWQRKVISLR